MSDKTSTSAETATSTSSDRPVSWPTRTMIFGSVIGLFAVAGFIISLVAVTKNTGDTGDTGDTGCMIPNADAATPGQVITLDGVTEKFVWATPSVVARTKFTKDALTYGTTNNELKSTNIIVSEEGTFNGVRSITGPESGSITVASADADSIDSSEGGMLVAMSGDVEIQSGQSEHSGNVTIRSGNATVRSGDINMYTSSSNEDTVLPQGILHIGITGHATPVVHNQIYEQWTLSEQNDHTIVDFTPVVFITSSAEANVHLPRVTADDVGKVITLCNGGTGALTIARTYLSHSLSSFTDLTNVHKVVEVGRSVQCIAVQAATLKAAPYVFERNDAMALDSTARTVIQKQQDLSLGTYYYRYTGEGVTVIQKSMSDNSDASGSNVFETLADHWANHELFPDVPVFEQDDDKVPAYVPSQETTIYDHQGQWKLPSGRYYYKTTQQAITMISTELTGKVYTTLPETWLKRTAFPDGPATHVFELFDDEKTPFPSVPVTTDTIDAQSELGEEKHYYYYIEDQFEPTMVNFVSKSAFDNEESASWKKTTYGNWMDLTKFRDGGSQMWNDNSWNDNSWCVSG